MNDIKEFAEISQLSCFEKPQGTVKTTTGKVYQEILFEKNTNISLLPPSSDTLVTPSNNGQNYSYSTGFTAHSYFSETDKTLVISYAGTDTDSYDDWVLNNARLAFANDPIQLSEASQFYKDSVAVANEKYGNFNIVLTGHSLGGYLAQRVAVDLSHNAKVVAFNSQGLTKPFPGDVNLDVTYVFSDPEKWGFAGQSVHTLGYYKGDVQFVRDAEGHGMKGIIDGLTGNSIVWTPEQLKAYYIDKLDKGEITPKWLVDKLPLELGDVLGGQHILKDILVGSNKYDTCFPAGTLIALANNAQKPVEDIRHGDIVLSHDKNGNLTPSIVDKLFTNTTDAFIRLSFTDGREDLIATPGHHFLTEAGDYMEIGHMARLGGGNVRLVDTDGSIISATAERLEYSAETADLFEQSQTKTIAFSGNTMLIRKAA